MLVSDELFGMRSSYPMFSSDGRWPWWRTEVKTQIGMKTAFPSGAKAPLLLDRVRHG